MTEARAQLYANLRWLVAALIARVGGDVTDLDTVPVAVDPVETWCLADSIAALLGALEADESRGLAERCPALDRWRQQILESRGRTPLEQAAAWELTALVCEQDGADSLVEHALANAQRALAARSAA